ncbi:hypothetical protein RN001_010926 [Aquatica leii]|uniref:Uncharacterized protein n=1 Tax=Aquatica leii TaxID=1421715 RepID=A0AAN7Q3P6_9COLE|nr:hypothetical protein RN001_010926 [Aquatica leii]
MEQFHRIHLEICRLANATHEAFYVPMLITLLTKCIYAFTSPIVCYFSLVDLLSNGFNIDGFFVLTTSCLTIVSTAITSFYLVDCYTYTSNKANTFSMSTIHRLQYKRLDDYIEQCSLQLVHQKLAFLVAKISPINRELIYSAFGSIISALLIVVQYHQSKVN